MTNVRSVFDSIPLLVLFALTAMFVVLTIEAGFRMGRAHQRGEGEQDAPVGTLVGAVLALLGFVMAFTFNFATTRYEERRHWVIEEANAIGTAYLRAQLLPEPHRSAVSAQLREYLDVRLLGWERTDEMLRRSEALHDRLWESAIALADKAPSSVLFLSFVQSLNAVIDVYTLRDEARLRSPIPDTIWMAVYALMAVGMTAMGYQMGVAKGRNPLVVVAATIGFSIVLLLIADLDRPAKGLIQTNHGPLLDLQQKLQVAPSSSPGAD